MASNTASGGHHFVPNDVKPLTLNSSGNPGVDQARKNLLDKIDFMGKSDTRFQDPAQFFYAANTKTIIPELTNPYERHGCHTQIFSYWSGHDAPQSKWVSEVLFATRGDLTEEDLKKDFPLYIDFHGGGFTTGDIRHGAWKQKHKLEFLSKNNFIYICPNYPVLPWFDGQDIEKALTHFWTYISNGAFQKDLKEFNPKLKFRSDNIIVSGDSAGAWLAILSLLNQNVGEHIGAVYMQYPMLRHYKRDYKDPGVDFMINKVQRDTINGCGAALRKAHEAWRAALKAAGMSPFYIDIPRPWAPLGMPAAFLGSHYRIDETKDIAMWQEWYQNGNENLGDIPQLLGDAKTQNILENREHLPYIYAFHSHGDPNCPIEDIQNAIQTLKDYYKVNKNYQKDWESRFYLAELQGLGHGFDHQYSVNEPKARCISEINSKLEAMMSGAK